MITEFVTAWDKNKDLLKKYFKTHKQEEFAGDYVSLVKALFDIVINPAIGNYTKFDTDNIITIDDGDWQGCRIFILHKNKYQPIPSDYVSTYAWYGSCSYCDILQGIRDNNYFGLPTDSQVDDYVNECLHILQRCRYIFGD